MTTRVKRTEQITVARKKQILDAALVVFSQKGFGEATIADIAAEAHTGIGTIYNYYKDKRDLLISLVAENLISETLVSVIANAQGKSDEEFMKSLLIERLDFGLDNAQKLLFLFFEIQRDTKLRQQYVTQVISPLLSMLEDYIRAQVANGNFRRVDEKVIARTIAGAFIGNMILYRLERRDSPFKKSRVNELADELSSLFLHGLKKN
ncbi:MAG: TetR/AcrR family transcriptional regulator [Dehalococcoidia bacterium]